MLIGVDFDNTIVCYDRLFHAIAREQGLIPADLPASKGAVRDCLRACGREEDWTELQGLVYGRRVGDAEAFPGALAFFIRCRERGVPVCIISHKTRRPYRGPACDLHEAARGWLEAQGFHDPERAGLAGERVWLELTKAAKVARIAALGCTHFIDDLPEFLAEIPETVERILFDPNGQHPEETRFRRAGSWEEIGAQLLTGSRGAAGGTHPPTPSPDSRERDTGALIPRPLLPSDGRRGAALGAEDPPSKDALLPCGERRGAALGADDPPSSDALLPSDGRRVAEGRDEGPDGALPEGPSLESRADVHLRARGLVVAAGLPDAITLHPLPGGANNRVYRVDAGGRSALLKAYFRHPADPRDRRGAEWAFSRFAWDAGLRCVPQPLANDREAGLGLYAFVEGRRLAPEEVTRSRVEEALAFARELNRHRETPAARALPTASEACFSLQAHLECVARRVRRLDAVGEGTRIDREARSFVGECLVPSWEKVAETVRDAAAKEGWPLAEELPREARCVSPSDFGFHNALLSKSREVWEYGSLGGRETGDRRRETEDGMPAPLSPVRRLPSSAHTSTPPHSHTLCFLDFEYAGWDDPAKLVCDFFCQPAVPVPMEHFAPFAEGVAGLFAEPERSLRRMALLLPIYRLKWCCILLNDFLPVGDERRRFAGSGDEGRKAGQLAKAREMLERGADPPFPQSEGGLGIAMRGARRRIEDAGGNWA